MTKERGQIHPARQVVMRLPDTDPNKDPWTGAAIDDPGRNLPDDSPIDENVSLLPPLGKTCAEVEAELTEPVRPEDYLPLVDEQESDHNWLQFTLSDILILMTACGVALGGARLLPTGLFALLAGLITLLFLAVVRDQQISRPRFRTIVIGLMTIYLVSTAASIGMTLWQG